VNQAYYCTPYTLYTWYSLHEQTKSLRLTGNQQEGQRSSAAGHTCMFFEMCDLQTQLHYLQAAQCPLSAAWTCPVTTVLRCHCICALMPDSSKGHQRGCGADLFEHCLLTGCKGVTLSNDKPQLSDHKDQHQASSCQYRCELGFHHLRPARKRKCAAVRLAPCIMVAHNWFGLIVEVYLLLQILQAMDVEQLN